MRPEHMIFGAIILSIVDPVQGYLYMIDLIQAMTTTLAIVVVIDE